jgi:hypothetical protein
MKLIFGCGRARNVYYNPLYQPPPHEQLDPQSPGGRAIATGRIVADPLCHHVGNDVVTVDLDALKCPDFTANVKDAAALRELEQSFGRQSFDEIELENFPYSALKEGDGGEHFFHCCFYLLKLNGTLTITTGGGVARDGSHQEIERALKRAGFEVAHGPEDGRYRFTAAITFGIH